MSAQFTLALETSTLRGSVAIGRGGTLLASRALTAERRHAAELMPAIRDLLRDAGAAPADVECVAFSQGPGSFTGLRVAATIARIWRLTSGCDVVAVPSLEVLACNAAAEVPHAASAGASRGAADASRHVAALLDARQGKIFAAVYALDADGTPRELVSPALAEAAAWLAQVEPPCMAEGDGLGRHREAAEAAGLTVLDETLWWPRAEHVLRLGAARAAAGRFCAPEVIVPNYMRPPECEEVYEQRRAEARARRGE